MSLPAKRKYHPDFGMVRRQSRLVCAAVKGLSNLGVEVLVVRFKEPAPVIEVSRCRGVDSLPSAMKGRGRNSAGALYVRKVACFHGCAVEWEEECL